MAEEGPVSLELTREEAICLLHAVDLIFAAARPEVLRRPALLALRAAREKLHASHFTFTEVVTTTLDVPAADLAQDDATLFEAPELEW